MRQHINGLAEVLWYPRPAQYEMRASATYICPNHFAHQILMVLLLCMGFISIKRISLGLRLVMGYTVLSILPPLFLSQSRSAWLGFIAGLFILFFGWTWKKNKWLSLITVFAVLPSLFAAVFMGLWNYSEMFKSRINEVIHGKFSWDSIENIRLVIWPDTIDMINARPWFGFGGGTYLDAFTPFRHLMDHATLSLRYAHNEYLHLLAEYGIVGAVLLGSALFTWLFFLTRVFFSKRSQTESSLAITGIAVTVASMVHALFDFNFHMFANGQMYAFCAALITSKLCLMKTLPEHVPATSKGRVLLWLFPFLCVACSAWSAKSFVSWNMREQARKYMEESEQTEKGLRILEQVKTLDPLHAEPYEKTGNYYLNRAFWARLPMLQERRKEYIEKAELAYEEALKRNEFDSKAVYGLARLAELEGDRSKTIALFNRAIEKDPVNVGYRIELGLLLKKWGQEEEALSVFQEARTFDWNNRTIILNIRTLQKSVKAKP